MKVFLFVLVIFLSIGLTAQQKEQEEVDISEISLEDLLNTPITVAGKKAQKISEAPAIISVLTADDLKLMGANNLYEALSFIPGINLTETYYGYSSVEFRGMLQTNYNNKSLLLINDHPLYETIVGSFYLEQIPINAIERIEILRGPGSTLYGTNAYAGVIKVITKEAGAFKNGEISFAGGSFSTIYPQLAAGYKSGDFQTAIFVNYLSSDGFDYNVKSDEEKRSGSLKYKDNFLNGIFNLSYKDFKFHAGYFKNDKDKFGVVPRLVTTGERNLKGFFADGSYNLKVSAKVNINILIYYDSYSKEEEIGWWPPSAAAKAANNGSPQLQEYSGSKLGIDLAANFSIGKNSTLIAGLMYEEQNSDPYTWKKITTNEIDYTTSAYTQEQSSYDYGGYIQFDTKIDKFGLVAGMRIINNKDYGTKVTPRAGIVFNATPRLSFKALYGQAFRNPNFFEKYVATQNVLFGDPALNPEKINTFDLGIDWMWFKNNSLRLNYYYFTTDDLIARSKIIPAGEKGNTVNTPQYGNTKGQKISGLEVELKGNLVQKADYFLNFSTIFSAKESATDVDIMFIPKLLSNAGINMKLNKFTISPYLQYVGSKKGTLTNKTEAEIKSYFLLNLNLNFKLNKTVELQLIGKNLTDEEYFYPEYIRRNIAEIPGGPGLQIYGQVIINF